MIIGIEQEANEENNNHSEKVLLPKEKPIDLSSFGT